MRRRSGSAGDSRHTLDTEPARTRDEFSSSVVAVADITTAWGKATLVDEVRVQQRAGDKRFASLVQLLEDPKG